MIAQIGFKINLQEFGINCLGLFLILLLLTLKYLENWAGNCTPFAAGPKVKASLCIFLLTAVKSPYLFPLIKYDLFAFKSQVPLFVSALDAYSQAVNQFTFMMLG